MPARSRISSVPLGSVRAFEAAARLGSFKATALALSVTPAAISHQIGILENHLGVPLFTRSNRLVRLTEKGTLLAAAASQSLRILDEALEVAAGPRSRTRQTLVVSSAPSFATKWLVPRLQQFHESHPHVDLRLTASNTLIDVAHDQSVDVVLRYGRGPYTGLHAERLWDHGCVFPVCSPRVARAAKLPLRTPDDLARHVLLRVPFPPRAVSAQTDGAGWWRNWLSAIGNTSADVLAAAQRGPLYSNSHLALDVAASGRGIALAVDVLAQDDLASGRLVRPFDLSARNEFSHWLIFRRDRRDDPNVRAFAEWIRAVAGERSRGFPAARIRHRFSPGGG